MRSVGANINPQQPRQLTELSNSTNRELLQIIQEFQLKNNSLSNITLNVRNDEPGTALECYSY